MDGNLAVHRPSRCATAAAALLLLPLASVYPAPRSQISIWMLSRSSTFMNCTLVRFGKRRCVSSNGPNCRARSALIFGNGTTQCGLPIVAAQKVNCSPAQMNRFVEDFAARAGHGDFVAPETDLAHLDAHGLAAVQDRGPHQAAGRFDGKFILADQFPVPQKARKNAQAVAALFRLAAVGIENAEREHRFLEGRGPSKMPSEPMPKLRWQITLICAVVSGDGRFFGSMTR